MSSEQVLLVAAGVVALVALLVALRAHRRASRAEAAAAAVADRVALLDPPAADVARQTADDPGVGSYLITSIDRGTPEQAPEQVSHPAPVAQPIDGRLFADIVARETVVKAASWTHGLRRALSPEARNRIRFEVRQGTRRAGRERRAEMKQALREFRARERAAAPTTGEDVA